MNCIKTRFCKLFVSTLVDPLYIIKYYPYRYAFRLRRGTKYYIGGFNINVGTLKITVKNADHGNFFAVNVNIKVS